MYSIVLFSSQHIHTEKFILAFFKFIDIVCRDSSSIHTIKTQFEAEITDWRSKVTFLVFLLES
jgi:hypothetical protein